MESWIYTNMDGHSGEKSVQDVWEVERVVMDVEGVVMNAVSMCDQRLYTLGENS